MIYQYEARGADAAITNAIDTHIAAIQDDDPDDDDGTVGTLVPVGQWPADGPAARYEP